MHKRYTFHEKEVLYWEYRQYASDALLPSIRVEYGPNIRFSDINAEALKQVIAWRDQYVGELRSRKPGWDWIKEVEKYKRRPRRIELAIWVNSQLCGMAVGRVSDRRIVASIHLLESNPAGNPLQGNIAIIATRWLEVFAKVISCKEIAIERPEQKLIQFYRN